MRNCEYEVITATPEFHAVTLSFDTADGVRELPLSPAAGVEGADRFELAAAFYSQLDEAVGRTLSGAPRASSVLSEAD